VRDVAPRQRHRFSQAFFIDRIQPDGGAALPAPRARLCNERRSIPLDELLLFVDRPIAVSLVNQRPPALRRSTRDQIFLDRGEKIT
jgi:hypothetical protein